MKIFFFQYLYKDLLPRPRNPPPLIGGPELLEPFSMLSFLYFPARYWLNTIELKPLKRYLQITQYNGWKIDYLRFTVSNMSKKLLKKFASSKHREKHKHLITRFNIFNKKVNTMAA